MVNAKPYKDNLKFKRFEVEQVKNWTYVMFSENISMDDIVVKVEYQVLQKKKKWLDGSIVQKPKSILKMLQNQSRTIKLEKYFQYFLIIKSIIVKSSPQVQGSAIGTSLYEAHA